MSQSSSVDGQEETYWVSTSSSACLLFQHNKRNKVRLGRANTFHFTRRVPSRSIFMSRKLHLTRSLRDSTNNKDPIKSVYLHGMIYFRRLVHLDEPPQRTIYTLPLRSAIRNKNKLLIWTSYPKKWDARTSLLLASFKDTKTSTWHKEAPT